MRVGGNMERFIKELFWFIFTPLVMLEVFLYSFWNGMTCWPDTKKNMKAGLVHDALYQLIQEGLLAMSWKNAADLTFLEMLKAEDDITANLCFFAVQTLGDYFIKYPDAILEV